MTDPYYSKKEVQKRIIKMFQPPKPLKTGLDILRESIKRRKLPRI